MEPVWRRIMARGEVAVTRAGLAVAMLLVGACTTTTTPPAGPACGDPFTACGGDVVGVWTLRQVCITDDLSSLVSLNEEACSDFLQNVTVAPNATYTFSESTLVVSGELAVDIQIRLSDSCLQALSMQDSLTADERTCGLLEEQYNDPENQSIAGAECEVASGGCLCTLYSPRQTVTSNATYFVRDNALVSDSDGEEPFCVDDRTMTVMTQVMGLDATMILKKR